MKRSSYNPIEKQKTVDTLCRRYDDNIWAPEIRYSIFKLFVSKIAKGYGIVTETQLDAFNHYVNERFKRVNPICFKAYKEIIFNEGRKKAAMTMRGRSTNPAYKKKDNLLQDPSEASGSVDLEQVVGRNYKGSDE